MPHVDRDAEYVTQSVSPEPIAEVIERVLRPSATTTLTQLAHDARRLATALAAAERVVEAARAYERDDSDFNSVDLRDALAAYDRKVPSP